MTHTPEQRQQVKGERACTRCGVVKSYSEFYRGPAYQGYRDGIVPQCKPCKIKMVKEWAAANPRRRRESCLKWNSRNREQKSASSKVLRQKKKAADAERLYRVDRERTKP